MQLLMGFYLVSCKVQNWGLVVAGAVVAAFLAKLLAVEIGKKWAVWTSIAQKTVLSSFDPTREAMSSSIDSCLGRPDRNFCVCWSQTLQVFVWLLQGTAGLCLQ